MMGGIDTQVQQRVDSYRDNPQALMQRYQQQQELIDLLAMQKLKSEKEEAARQMQMQMPQQPQTIKEQREAELKQLSQQEIAKTLGMGNRPQGAPQQGAPQQGSPQQGMPPQGRPPQGAPQQSGIAGLPTPPMQGMASGGVVSFAQGGEVDMLEQRDRLSRIKSMLLIGKDPADLIEEGYSPEELKMAAQDLDAQMMTSEEKSRPSLPPAMTEKGRQEGRETSRLDQMAPDYSMISPATGETRNRPDWMNQAIDYASGMYDTFELDQLIPDYSAISSEAGEAPKRPDWMNEAIDYTSDLYDRFEREGGIGGLFDKATAAYQKTPLADYARYSVGEVKDAYEEDGIGAAIGSGLRQASATPFAIYDTLSELSGDVSPVDILVNEPAKALEKFFTGEVSETPTTIGDIYNSLTGETPESETKVSGTPSVNQNYMGFESPPTSLADEQSLSYALTADSSLPDDMVPEAEKQDQEGRGFNLDALLTFARGAGTAGPTEGIGSTLLRGGEALVDERKAQQVLALAQQKLAAAAEQQTFENSMEAFKAAGQLDELMGEADTIYRDYYQDEIEKDAGGDPEKLAELKAAKMEEIRPGYRQMLATRIGLLRKAQEPLYTLEQE